MAIDVHNLQYCSKKWIGLVCFADTIGPSRWNPTPTWLKLVWPLTRSCLNGFTIPEIPAAQGKCKHMSMYKTHTHHTAII